MNLQTAAKLPVIEQLNIPVTHDIFTTNFNYIQFPILPEDYRYKYYWNTETNTSELQIQKRYWKLWRSQFKCSIQPKNPNDIFSLLQEITETSHHLFKLLNRQLFTAIIN